MPAADDARFEFRVDADRVLRGPRAGYVTVRIRRPTLLLRGLAPGGLVSTARCAEQLSRSAPSNAQDSVSADRCFLCRSMLGQGRPSCPACSPVATSRMARLRDWIGLRPAPLRTRTPSVAELAEHSVIAYEDLGEISLRLAMAPSED